MNGGFLTKAAPQVTRSDAGELPEPEAIRLAQQGDERGFERIYRLHSQRVYALCLRMMRGNAAEAEELTQESFLQLFRKIGTFRGESAFSTWLHRLAFNIVLMRLRRHSFQVLSLDEMLEPGEKPPGYRRNTSEAGTCGSPGQRIAWTFNVLLSSFRQATRPSSFSTTCRVTSTEKSPLFGGAHWGIRNRNCTRLARVYNTCYARVSAITSTISGRTWNQFWIRCQPFDTEAQKEYTAAKPEAKSEVCNAPLYLDLSHAVR